MSSLFFLTVDVGSQGGSSALCCSWVVLSIAATILGGWSLAAIVGKRKKQQEEQQQKQWLHAVDVGDFGEALSVSFDLKEDGHGHEEKTEKTLGREATAASSC